jgi:hypothetical protein
MNELPWAQIAPTFTIKKHKNYLTSQIRFILTRKKFNVSVQCWMKCRRSEGEKYKRAFEKNEQTKENTKERKRYCKKNVYNVSECIECNESSNEIAHIRFCTNISLLKERRTVHTCHCYHLTTHTHTHTHTHTQTNKHKHKHTKRLLN